MRFLANENFPLSAVEALRERGHDVAWIRTIAPGCSDRDVLERAQREARVLLTFDKDFGALAFVGDQAVSAGIVLFRIAMISPSHLAEAVVNALESRSDWAGLFAVVHDDRIRVREFGGE